MDPSVMPVTKSRNVMFDTVCLPSILAISKINRMAATALSSTSAYAFIRKRLPSITLLPIRLQTNRPPDPCRQAAGMAEIAVAAPDRGFKNPVDGDSGKK